MPVINSAIVEDTFVGGDAEHEFGGGPLAMPPVYDSWPLELDPERHGLGALTAVHRARAALLVQLVILCAAVSGMAFLAWWLALKGAPRLIEHTLGWIFMAFAIAMCGALWQLVRNFHLHVLIFVQGLVWLRGRQTIACRWEEIDAVWSREMPSDEQKFHLFLWLLHPVSFSTYVFSGGFHAYTIRMHDGRKLTFTSYLDGIQQLGATILQETGSRLLHQALASYDAGETIDFGRFQVSPAGVCKGKRLLLWDEIGEACIEEGLVIVKKRGEGSYPWLHETAENVPNVHVLVAMVNAIVSRNPEQEQAFSN